MRGSHVLSFFTQPFSVACVADEEKKTEEGEKKLQENLSGKLIPEATAAAAALPSAGYIKGGSGFLKLYLNLCWVLWSI